MGIIHVLDERVANQIAAGEVIERPVSAVKELVVNAIDAGACTIRVEVMQGGVDLIRLTDDGSGIEKDDMPLAVKRHATSKIEHFNDVYKLHTFGFRGEALASIAAISRLKITSGQDETTPANVLTKEPNAAPSYSVAAPHKGTIIEVRDLYYNVPARKKFVKSNNHESALIYDFVCKMAMGRPDIAFTFVNNGELQSSSNNLTNTQDIMHHIFGEASIQDIVHFSHEGFYQQQDVAGWFYPIHVTRKNRNQMVYFVNGRLIESKELDAIVEEAVYTLIPKGRFPICVLSLQLPAFNVDVNVHPSKKLIKFKNIDEWKDTLATLIKEELWLTKLNESISLSPQTKEVAPLDDVQEAVKPQTLRFEQAPSIERTAQTEPVLVENKATKKAEQPRFEEANDFFMAAEKESDYAPVTREVPRLSELEILPKRAEEKEAQLSKENLLELEYIGQLNNTFILAQDSKHLYIIDQHTMHERILYERFMKAAANEKVAQQPLLHPELIKLTPMQEDTLVSNIFLLGQLGFGFEKKGPLLYAVNTLPAVLSTQEDIGTMVTDLLDDVETGVLKGGLAKLNEERIIMASCKAAVKAHHRLSEREVKEHLLPELCKLENAHTCPHGRPIIMSISMNELYLYFKRGSFK